MGEREMGKSWPGCVLAPKGNSEQQTSTLVSYTQWYWGPEPGHLNKLTSNRFAATPLHKARFMISLWLSKAIVQSTIAFNSCHLTVSLVARGRHEVTSRDLPVLLLGYSSARETFSSFMAQTEKLCCLQSSLRCTLPDLLGEQRNR